VTGTANQELYAGGRAYEFNAELLRCACRPHSGEISLQFVSPQRRVSLILVEKLECANEPPLICLLEQAERLEELRRQAERLEFLDGQRFFRRFG
jgi:hypothetical protein